MESKCAYCDKKPEIECLCKYRMKYFCSDHYLQHRKELPNLRHIAQDIWPENEDSNEVCTVCNINSPTMCCICNNQINYLCQDCIGLHSQIGVSHSLEPLEAAKFIRDSQDMSKYFNRKTRIQKLLMFIGEVQNNVELNKKRFKNAIEKAQDSLQKIYAKGENDFKDLENSLSELKAKAELTQFAANLDLSDFLNRLIDEEDFTKFVANLQGLDLYSISINTSIFEKACENFLLITNKIPYINEKREQVIAHYNANSQQMDKAISELYQNVIQSKNLGLEKISILSSDKPFVKDLSLVIEYFPRLSTFDISGTILDKITAKQLISSLKTSHELTEISLADCSMLDEGCEALSNILPNFPLLESLYLHKNGITEIGAQQIFSVFPCVQRLKLISLNQNTIGDEGLSCLAGIVKNMPVLEAIGLQCNHITGRSSKGICKIISELMTLTDLSLDDNKLGNDAALDLLKVLPNIKRSMKLYLRNCGISEQLEDELKTVGGGHVSVAISYRIY